MPARSVTTDVVVVGAGPAGLMAAASAARRGLRVVLVESDEVLGGSGAAGDGLLWLPRVPVGERGPGQAARSYLDALYGPGDPRREAFVESAADLYQELADLKAPLALVPGEPDGYPEETGGRRSGRVFEPVATTTRRLGRQAAQVRLRPSSATFTQRRRMVQASRSPRGVVAAVHAFGGRAVLSRLVGREPAVGGSALLVGLVAAVLEAGVEVWRGCPLETVDPGHPAAAVVRRDGDLVTLVAERGVVLSVGGFSHDLAARREHLGPAADEAWSLACPGADGTALRLGRSLGAAQSGFGGAEWQPSLRLVDQTFHSVDLARGLPGALLVDAAGTRFCNESSGSVELGRVMLDRSRRVSAAPAFLVVDARHRSRFPLGPWPPRLVTSNAVRDQEIAKAEHLTALAEMLGVDKAGLVGTVARFNAFARKGRDDDFRRGASARDKAHGLVFHRPNRALGVLDLPPYYAVRVYPAEISTRGGLLTDAAARVLSGDGEPVPGLFAVGAASALPWGDRDPGPGAGLAASLVAAMRAAAALADPA